MPPLPAADRAIVDEAKIDRYLLSVSHPVGRAKAAFFLRFGFSLDAPDELRAALLLHARSAAIVFEEATSFGRKYILERELGSPDRRNPLIRSVWVVEPDETAPRLVTAYPLYGR